MSKECVVLQSVADECNGLALLASKAMCCGDRRESSGFTAAGKYDLQRAQKINRQSKLRHFFLTEMRNVKCHAYVCVLCRCGGFVC